MKNKFILPFLCLSLQVPIALGKELFTDYNYDDSASWPAIAAKTPEAVEGLLAILRRSTIGAKLITKAEGKALSSDKVLSSLIEAGPESLTDTTFTRRTIFDGEFKTVYEETSRIVLNKQLSIEDAVLNLAHELTHFVFRHKVNPYEEVSLKDYISHVIEGKGGEVDAILIECRVAKELYPKRFEGDQGCQKIYGESAGSGNISESSQEMRERTIQLFYRMGYFWSDFNDNIRLFHFKMSDDFPLITKDQPLFFSAVYGTPYPLAAVAEYKEILKKICRNEETRMIKLKEKAGWSETDERYLNLQKLYIKKCQTI